MATTDLDLEADSDVQSVTFDLPATIAPYARDYFENSGMAREGETIDLFICRLFCERAIRHKSSTIIAAQRKAASDLLTLDEVDLNNQGTALLEL